MLKNFFAILQQVGKALMLPVALLPAAGILLAFGNAFQNPSAIELIPMLGNPLFQSSAKLIEQAGGILFTNLPLLFTVGVALGLAGGEGVAGLAAIVAFLVMNVTMGLVAGVTPELLTAKNPAFTSVLGIPTLQTGVFGGIIVGVFAATVYKRYYNMTLPAYLSFFAGKRFVPIVSASGAMVLGIVMVFLWPPVQNGLNYFSHNMIDANKTQATFIFGVVERSLIPFGLHHIFYNPFWYQFGSYVSQAGVVVNGDQSIFFAQLKDGVPFSAGAFMTGKFPFMMFGLPAAALAIYHEARPEKRLLVAGIMGSAALTSFLTGITEPIEFSFLFVAPLLFGLHCFFAGLSFMTMQLLDVKIGMTFSGGVIDFILFGVIPNRTHWWLVIPVGMVFAVIYYFGFRWAIRRWDLKTPGREIDDSAAGPAQDETAGLAGEILKALGGKANLVDLDACITRLRVRVKQMAEVDQKRFKQLGAAGVMVIGDNLQIVFGPKSDQLKTQIQAIISGGAVGAGPSAEPETVGERPAVLAEKSLDNSLAGNRPMNKDVVAEGAEKKMFERFRAPLEGRLVSLEQVPDAVFAGKIMGEGFAIDPTSGDVISPVDGTVTSFMADTRHAVGITADDGTEVLIHIGIDTVKLGGAGFVGLVAQDDPVKAGQLLLKVDLEQIKGKVPSLISPVVFTNLPAGQSVKVESGRAVKRGEEGFFSIS
jgi:PTS system D-glucosamine-specific IIC component